MVVVKQEAKRNLELGAAEIEYHEEVARFQAMPDCPGETDWNGRSAEFIFGNGAAMDLGVPESWRWNR